MTSLFCLNIVVDFCGFDILIFCCSISHIQLCRHDIVIVGCYRIK